LHLQQFGFQLLKNKHNYSRICALRHRFGGVWI